MSVCPIANEFGVRNNPVCVDGVDTTQFQNVTDVGLNFNSITSGANIVVSLILHNKLHHKLQLQALLGPYCFLDSTVNPRTSFN